MYNTILLQLPQLDSLIKCPLPCLSCLSVLSVKCQKSEYKRTTKSEYKRTTIAYHLTRNKGGKTIWISRAFRDQALWPPLHWYLTVGKAAVLTTCSDGWWVAKEWPCDRQVQVAHQEARQKPLCGPDMNLNASISTPPLLASLWISERTKTISMRKYGLEHSEPTVNGDATAVAPWWLICSW